LFLVDDDIQFCTAFHLAYNYTHVLNYMYVYNPGKRLSSLIPAHANYHNRTHTHTQIRKILSLSKRKKKKQDLTTRAEHIRLDEPFAGTLVCACIIKMLLLGCAAVAEVLCNYNGAGIYYIYHTHS
jgi:hypothetical protein